MPLSEEFFALVRGIKIGSSSLPKIGSGYQGEFTGLMADYQKHISRKIAK